MLIAEVICSDERCAELTERIVGRASDLDAAACDCGCTFVVLSLSAWEPAEARVLELALAA